MSVGEADWTALPAEFGGVTTAPVPVIEATVEPEIIPAPAPLAFLLDAAIRLRALGRRGHQSWLVCCKNRSAVYCFLWAQLNMLLTSVGMQRRVEL